ALFTATGFAQPGGSENHYADSLNNVLQQQKSDTAKASVLNKISDYYSYRDSTKAIRYALQSLQLSKGNNYYTALAHFYIGGIYFDNNVSKSEKEYLTTIELLKSDSSKSALQYRARAWHNYGVLQQKKNDSKGFVDILLNKAIPLSIQAKDTMRIAFNYHDVGLVFMNFLDYEKALSYYKIAIGLMKRMNVQSEELAGVYIDVAKTYIFNEKFSAAKPFLDSARSILKPFEDSYYGIDYFTVDGMYNYHIHQWKPAFQSLDTALQLAKKFNSSYDVYRIIYEKYKAYKEQQNYPEAKKQLLKAFDILKIVPTDGNKVQLLYEMAQTEAKLGNLNSAFKWLNQYAEFTDSVFSKKSKTDIAALEIKYNTEKNQKEILSLQNKNKSQQLVLQRNRFVNYLLMAAFAFAILLLLFILFLYRNKKRMIGQQETQHLQKIKEIEQDQKMNVYNAMLEGQELERRRMARDLHDGLGGILAGVKIKLSDIAEKNKTHSDMELYKVIRQLDNSVEELRRIARNMMPETLIRYGLETALRDLCSSLQTNASKIDLEVYELSRNMSQPIQITIYRILQELLTNALKHAGADKIIVQCSQNEDIVFITVEDNGKGFDINELIGKKGIGLDNIRNRVSFLKGKTDIQSTPGEGTTINIEVHATG
ncbi:MAG: sensor histidine kinase, partial [Bacteroidota bacterium]|nr:sensor histidine kinase [Bacteroidota bacterium]